ncbi:MAG: hypothetical protein HQ495_10230 [Alphaproteobacteria bacterium]|nr:hypothetical protein [Alphaproteobacteria bacterium]
MRTLRVALVVGPAAGVGRIASALLILATVLGVATITTETRAQNKSDADKAFEVASEFAQCAALFDALSEFMKRAGQPDAAQTFGDTGNGAQIASIMVASNITSWDQATQMAENIRASTGPYWKTLVINEGVQGDEVQQRMAVCAALNPLQVELVQEARKRAYGFGDDKPAD